MEARKLNKHLCITVSFFLAGILSTVWIICGLLSPPSNKAYNPQNSEIAQRTPLEQFMPPANENYDEKITQKTSKKEIETWQSKSSDLAAQWEAADMANLTFRIGILGVILLAWTVWETRRAASAAALTLTTANKTLREAKATSVKQLQAYLRIEKCEILRDGNEIRIKLTVKNYGSTPAYYVKINGTPFFSRDKGSHDQVKYDNDFEYAIFASSLAHQQSGCVELTDTNTDNLPYVHLNGYIEYDDIYSYNEGACTGSRRIGLCRFAEFSKIPADEVSMQVIHYKEHARDAKGDYGEKLES